MIWLVLLHVAAALGAPALVARLGARAFWVVAAAPAAAQTPGKLGYVNTQAVLAQTPARQSAEEQFNRQMTPYNTEIARMDSTLKARITAFQRDTAAPVAQRQQREREWWQSQWRRGLGPASLDWASRVLWEYVVKVNNISKLD